ncbi:N-acetyltransferase, partial [Streptococcus oralis]|nr:N-acetyltransferase [Streptococcus oralis]
MTTIRPIQAQDDAQIAKIIRNALESVGLDKPGTAY